MNIGVHVGRRKPMDIVDLAGIALCILVGVTFAAAMSGWMFIYFDLSELRARLVTAHTERTSQISQVGSALQTMEARLEVVSRRLDEVQRLIRSAADEPTPEKILNLPAIPGALQRTDCGSARQEQPQ